MKAGTGRSLAFVVGSGALLLTLGGAVVAAPLTVPTLVGLARSRRGGALCPTAAVVAALTAAEAAWALVYVVAGESQPAIWSVPLAVAGVTGTIVLGARPGRSMAVSASGGTGRAKR